MRASSAYLTSGVAFRHRSLTLAVLCVTILLMRRAEAEKPAGGNG
jgi:hypothetical protein